MTNTTNASGPVLTSPMTFKGGRVYGLEIETLDFKVSLVFRTHDGRSRDYFKSSRVYGSLPVFVDGFDAEENRLFAAIPDMAVKDKALASFQRAAVKTARVGLLELLPVIADALRAAGHTVVSVPTEAKFSKKAGCAMCPCSPGFVLDTRLNVDGRGVDLHF